MRDNAPPFIAGRISSHYVWRSMPRFVSSLLVAIALLLAPLAMIGGADPAHAARPQVASAANCAEEAPGQKHEKRAPGMEVGCAIACAAVPATQPFSAERLPHAAMPPALLGSHLLSGIHPEGETPPPRMHPEI
ncbi:MAG: hypothetical protein ACK4SZ_14195 [Allosphingosinicella sp.]|uniref:hypothetical protein n=1 Tax=Allosphingosinicella sp. TaxID=2823234 RepID=UPI0039389EA8